MENLQGTSVSKELVKYFCILFLNNLLAWLPYYIVFSQEPQLGTA